MVAAISMVGVPPAHATPTGTFQFQVKCQEGVSAQVDPIKNPGVPVAPPWTGQTIVGSSGTSTTVDISGATDGNWVYAATIIATAQTGNVSATGWTTLSGLEGNEGTGTHYAILRHKKASGDTTFTFSWDTAQKAVIELFSYPGLDSTTPEEATSSSNVQLHTSAGASFPTPSVTPAAANRWALTISWLRSTATSPGSLAWTPDSALTERNEQQTTSNRWVSVEQNDSNGAVTQAAHSYTNVNDDANESHGGSILFYLKPAPDTTSMHLHQFFGNRLVSSTVTPTDLAKNYAYANPAGTGTTCDDGPGTELVEEDTALYWTPTLVDCVVSTGVCSKQVATSDVAYYKCIDFTDTECQSLAARPFGEQQVAGNPNCVYGNASVCGTDNYSGTSTGQPTGVVYWGCGDGYTGSDDLGRGNGTKSKQVVYCGDSGISGGDGLHVHITFPDCVDITGPDSTTHVNDGSYANKNSPQYSCPTGQTEVAALILRIDWAGFKPQSSTDRVFVTSDQDSTAGSGLVCPNPDSGSCTYPSTRNNEGISVHGDFMNGWIMDQAHVNKNVTVYAGTDQPNSDYTTPYGLTETPLRGEENLMAECINALVACHEI